MDSFTTKEILADLVSMIQESLRTREWDNGSTDKIMFKSAISNFKVSCVRTHDAIVSLLAKLIKPKLVRYKRPIKMRPASREKPRVLMDRYPECATSFMLIDLAGETPWLKKRAI